MSSTCQDFTCGLHWRFSDFFLKSLVFNFFKYLYILFFESFLFKLNYCLSFISKLINSFVLFSSVQFSHSVVSDSLQPHEWQHVRPPCPSPTPGVYPNPCLLSWWCHPTISSSVIILFLLPPIPPSIRVFSNESVLCIRWPKNWSFSFSISFSNAYSGLISFRMDWLDLLAVQGTLKESSPAPQFKSISSLALSLLYGPTLTSVHDYLEKP